jgi:hypothetical protein
MFPALQTTTMNMQPMSLWQLFLNNPEWALVVVGIFTLIVIGWQAVATAKAAEAAQTNANIVISKDRARVKVSPQRLDLSHPNKGRIHQVDYNVLFYGPSDAFIIDTAVWADTVESEDMETHRLYMPIHEIPPTVPPTTRVINCSALVDIKPEDVDKITQGLRFVRLYGFIRYRDVFEIERITTFRYLWKFPRLYGIALGNWGRNGPPGDNAET